jgi:hypothetical protein
MNDTELSRILTCVNTHLGKKYTVGVYAANRLPRDIVRPCAFIANTDNYGQSGTHWVAFFIPKKGSPEFFDSYGLDVLVDGHLMFMVNVQGSWKSNKMELQSLTSKVCGQYCLTFLIARMKGYSLRHYQKLFTYDSAKNDRQVRACIRKMFSSGCQLRCKAYRQQCCPRIK